MPESIFLNRIKIRFDSISDRDYRNRSLRSAAWTRAAARINDCNFVFFAVSIGNNRNFFKKRNMRMTIADKRSISYAAHHGNMVYAVIHAETVTMRNKYIFSCNTRKQAFRRA